ncbi:hypothetical protein [Magnetofaba australis]|uniref:hypothetical protein n=1 Tax=Magnetofaba australis TaxID=1472297 RepID=UPI000A19B811|nr:hypothetical protein [Magnetofaba australis]
MPPLDATVRPPNLTLWRGLAWALTALLLALAASLLTLTTRMPTLPPSALAWALWTFSACALLIPLGFAWRLRSLDRALARTAITPEQALPLIKHCVLGLSATVGAGVLITLGVAGASTGAWRLAGIGSVGKAIDSVLVGVGAPLVGLSAYAMGLLLTLLKRQRAADASYVLTLICAEIIALAFLFGLFS